MKYTGNFRANSTPRTSNTVKVNGSRHDEPEEIEISRASERDFRTYNATPDDAVAMANGAGYTARFGKQTLGYYATKRQALYEAGRLGAKAYSISRDGGSNRIVLTELDDEYVQQTASEIIADRIRDQIGAGDAPLSPLAKQRIVIMLFESCKDKEIAKECFQILYPASKIEQFDRLWTNLSEQNRQAPVEHSVTPPVEQKRISHTEQKRITPSDTFMQYATAREMHDIASAILLNDENACKKACSVRGVSPSQFEDLYSNAIQNDCIRNDPKFADSVLRHIARESVERRIDGDIFRMLKNEPSLKIMASAGNEEGVIDHLTSNGYSRRESEEICSEIISIGKLLNMM